MNEYDGSPIQEFGLSRYSTQSDITEAESMKTKFRESEYGQGNLKHGAFLGADFIKDLFLELLEPESKAEIEQLLTWKRPNGTAKTRIRYKFDGIRFCFGLGALLDHDEDGDNDRRRSMEIIASQVSFGRDGAGNLIIMADNSLVNAAVGQYYTSVPPFGAEPPSLPCPPVKCN